MDLIELQINILSNDLILNPNEIFWEEIIQRNCKTSFIYYEKSLRKKDQEFDKLRFCEFENLIHLWKGENSLTIKKSINEFKNIFSKKFKIGQITYDIAKLYIFKARLFANEKGI